LQFKLVSVLAVLLVLPDIFDQLSFTLEHWTVRNHSHEILEEGSLSQLRTHLPEAWQS
jgi:hypothetical protein